VRAIQVSERNGHVVGATQVFDNDEILMITDQGTMVRTRVKEISVIGRNTQGVRLINLTKGEKLVGLEGIGEIEEVAAEPESEIESEATTEVETPAESQDD
jgi:DNA gyrase subunit A